MLHTNSSFYIADEYDNTLLTQNHQRHIQNNYCLQKTRTQFWFLCLKDDVGTTLRETSTKFTLAT